MFNGCVLGVSSCAPAVLAPTSDKPSARHARCFFMAMVYDREVELFTARGRCGSNLSRVVQGDRVAYALRPLAPPGTFSLARLLRSRRHERRGCRPRWSPPPTAPKRASQLGSLHTWRVPNAQRLSSFEVSNPKGPGMPWLYTSALFHESSDVFFNALMILWICVEVSHLLQTQARPSRAQVRLPLRSSFHLHRFHRIRTLSHMAQFQHQTGYAVAGGPLQRAHR